MDFNYKISKLVNENTEQVLEDSFEMNKPIHVQLGRGQLKFIEMEEKLSTMVPGETSELMVGQDFVRYKIIIKLLQKYSQTDTSTEWECTDEEFYNLAIGKKEDGKVFFTQNKNISASRCYRTGIKYLRKIAKSKWDLNDRKARDLLITLFNNLLTCELKLKRYSNVVKFSTECINNIGENVKSYFKRGEANMNDGNHVLANEDFKKAKELLLTVDSKADISIISKIITGSSKSVATDLYEKMIRLLDSSILKCANLEAEHNQSMKNVFKKMF